MPTDSRKEINASSPGTVTESQTSSQISMSGEMHIDLPSMSLLDEITWLTSQMAPFGIMQTMFTQGGQSTKNEQQRSTPTSSTDEDEIYAEEERVSGFL